MKSNFVHGSKAARMKTSLLVEIHDMIITNINNLLLFIQISQVIKRQWP